MSTEQSPQNTPGSEAGTKPNLLVRFVIGLVIPACIIAGSVWFFKHQMDTQPKAQRKRPPQEARLVSVEAVQQTDYQTIVSAMGPVVPAQEVTLMPEVSGRVVFVDPLVIPGGVVEQGQTLIRLDVRDYEAVVKVRESELARAELNLKLEQGNQRIAQQEYQMLEDIVEDQDQELVLRQPHLEQARAALEAAKAALETARLNVERCTVKSPFNAVIQEKWVDVGAQVSQSSRLVNLMGTDEYWVQAKIPVDQLRWITIPDGKGQQGSAVTVFDEAAWGAGVRRQGRVLRLLGQLEEQGRLAQVLISVKDPQLLENNTAGLMPLLAGSYVRVQIEGKTLEGVIPVRREYLHDGDNIWIMNSDNRMEILPVTVVFRDKETVYVSKGLEAGDRIVTTDISAPVAGMLLRLNSAGPDTQKPETQE